MMLKMHKQSRVEQQEITLIIDQIFFYINLIGAKHHTSLLVKQMIIDI